jgi:membrane associated rhomboid family serine protease
MNNLPTVTRNLLIINALVFAAQWIVGPMDYPRQIDGIALYGGLRFFLDPNFHIYQLFTYMFLHGGFTHLFFNMFALWMFGRVMENVWGPRKFLIYYVVCGIGAALMQELVSLITMSPSFTIGASGSVYGILLAFGMTFPNERIFIFPIPIPIKAKWFVVGYVALELYSSISSTMDGVAHMAHLGGMLFGLLLILYWRRHPGSDARFSINRGQEFFNNMKRNFEQRQQSKRPDMHATRTGTKEDDMEYNARKRERQAEIDAILDKIRKSGYDSLTKEEKKKLFDASKEN